MSEPAAEWVDIEALTPWRDNPRKNEHAVDAVAESIKRFGFAAPIIARTDGEVIAGHTRLKAAQALGLDRVPVRYMDLDPADAKLLALADNKVGELAEWDDDRLSDILNELHADGVDLDGIGFSLEELGEIMALGAEPPEEEFEITAPDDVDAIPEDVPAITEPGEVVQLGRHTLTCGDCIEVMRGLPDNSVDAVVTDPPYGIGFMGKGWDCAVPGEDFAREALRVLKPGGHLIAFAATRTVHRLAVAIEDAGFEIRDQIAWLQWQGFPKSLDVSKAIDQHHGAERAVVGSYEVTRDFKGVDYVGRGSKATEVNITAPATADAKKWEGWGTALKPSQEPAILARKPLEGTVAENVLKWGVGGLNIDGCRYAYGDPAWPGPGEETATVLTATGGPFGKQPPKGIAPNSLGRWPANIYQCPKASRSEREAGCEELPDPSATVRDVGGAQHTKNVVLAKNHHPTVKPTALMRWLVRLVTPPGAVVLEPFCGSGTTLLAAELEGVTCWAIEREPGYCDIIRARHGGIIGEAE